MYSGDARAGGVWAVTSGLSALLAVKGCHWTVAGGVDGGLLSALSGS